MKQILFAIATALLIPGCLSCTRQPASVEPQTQYTGFVNVFIGTGGHGHTFPGATTPHGMVQLSPDTRLFGWDACSGYYYADSSIIGFSHTHLSGTGIGDYGDILFMPVAGEKPLKMGDAEHPDSGYRSRFSHAQEKAVPGYYQVMLADDTIHVELTASTSTGFHRYRYDGKQSPGLIIDMEPTIHGHAHPRTEITVLDDSTLCGMKYTEGWARRHPVYFYARFSTPFSYRLFSGDTLVTGSSVKVKTAKAYLTFNNVKPGDEVLVKVGISSVDEEGARKNMEQEIPHWEFDRVVADANDSWNKELSVIEVKTTDEEARTIFYTSLYHTAVTPYIASDVDGRYRTRSQDIAQSAAYQNYTVFSLWDTFRALHPLYTLIAPEKNQQYIRSLLAKYDESGILPKWDLASNETGTMIGYHAVSVIVDAFMKNQHNFDVEKAFRACLRSSIYDTTGIIRQMDRSILHNQMMPASIRYKNELGFIPADQCRRSVAQGLEFAYNDWLIARMAREIGKDDLSDRYMLLAGNYRNYFDPESELMRGKNSDGSWVTPFDPTGLGHSGDYVEGNAWQWSWFVPQDVEGLIALMGGKERFCARLDTLFTMSSDLTGDQRASLDVTGLIGQYAHGNEPSHHIPYLYNYGGQPWKTQALVDYILRTFYKNDPNGIIGNEDCGQMSAWYVLNALGIYSFCPGNPVYAIGRPLFDEVTVRLPENKTFVIRTHNNSKENKYIHSVKLNGKELDGLEIPHQSIVSGGLLEFEMSGEPAVR